MVQDTNIKWNFSDWWMNHRNALVMGILNITPDSFYDGGKYINEENILVRAKQIIDEGGTIIDIGACSTRPGAKKINIEEEEKRLLPVVKLVRKIFPNTVISVDTFRANIAEKVIDVGADMINDISGGTMDDKMFDTIARLNIPYVLMHIQGTPQTMQKNPQYNNVVKEVKGYFLTRVKQLYDTGFSKIILDPGFGFGKTIEHNYTLLSHLDEFHQPGLPVLAGLSRKSMITRVLDVIPEQALHGTIALNAIALLKGANMLRVHDVKEAVECINLSRLFRKLS